MTKRPFFWIATAFAIGIGLSGVLHLPLPVGLAALLFGALFAMVRRNGTVVILLVIAALGLTRYETYTSIASDDVSRFIQSRPSAVVGRITSDVDLRADRAMFPFEVSAVEVSGRRVPASGRLMVSYYRPDAPDWEPPTYGDVLLIRTRISRPGTAINPGEFSWRDYLSRQRIHSVAYVRSPEQVTRLANKTPNHLVALAIRMKEWISGSITAAMPADEASVVIGMDLGTYTTLPERLRSNFQRTGTLHLLAASGFNCAVLVAVFGFLLVRMLKLPRKFTYPALIAILILYMMMVGGKPSIVRATVMATLMLLGRVLKRPADVINLLFAAAVVILLINPADIFDIGFQLSFAAVFALILVLPVIEETAKRWKLNPATRVRRAGRVRKAALYLAREGWQGLAATAAATLGTLPLTAHYFNQLSLVSIVVNAIVAATVLPIFVIGLLLPALSSVPGVGVALSFAGTVFTRFALASINWFGEMPNSCLSVRSPGVYGIVGYYVLLAVGLSYAYSRIPGKKRAGGA